MKTVRTVSLAVVIGLATLAVGIAGTASAQEAGTAGSRGGIGVGYAAMLGGPSGLNGVYDAGRWHADAILGLSGNGGSRIQLGARGWYHLHHTTAADFSLGGGLGFDHINPAGDGESTDVVNIDIGFMIRAFVTSNVSINAFGGLTVLTGDGDGFALTGQELAGLGLTYYFF